MPGSASTLTSTYGVVDSELGFALLWATDTIFQAKRAQKSSERAAISGESEGILKSQGSRTFKPRLNQCNTYIVLSHVSFVFDLIQR